MGYRGARVMRICCVGACLVSSQVCEALDEYLEGLAAKHLGTLFVKISTTTRSKLRKDWLLQYIPGGSDTSEVNKWAHRATGRSVNNRFWLTCACRCPAL
eukprot:scaffold53078_cov43-Prasinocladus_malaysianus.AAC.2